MTKHILTFALLFLTGVSAACALKDNNLDTWIGANSKFSKNYIEGKCAIDQALVGLDDSTKSIIAKMIARSYKEKSKTVYAY